MPIAADDSAFLNLDENAYSGPITDPATVQLGEPGLRNGAAGSENDIVHNLNFLV
jgi:hypothetical protein